MNWKIFNNLFCYFLFIIFFTFPLVAYSQTTEIIFDAITFRSIYVNDWKMNVGDSIVWAASDYNDSYWQTGYINNTHSNESGIRWLRTSIIIDCPYDENDRIVIRIRNLVSAYEVYWDGVLIGVNGTVGKIKETEKPGVIIKTFSLHKNTTLRGRHILAIRYSNNHNINIIGNTRVIFGYENIMESVNSLVYRNSFFFLGGSIFAALFCLMLYFGYEKNKLYLLLCLIYLSRIIAIILEIQRNESSISLQAFNYLVIAGEVFFLLISLLDIIFIQYLLEFKKKKLITILSFTVLLIAEALKADNPLMFIPAIDFIVLLIVLILAAIATIKNILGGKIMLFIFIFGFLVNVYFLIIRNDFIGASILFPMYALVLNSGLILVIGLKIRERSKMFHQFELRSKQLEIELLKKSIQPHFLMNTLASVKSLYHENPVKAETLIDLIAEEFRIINKISSEKEIPISQEIELCESHLKIMGLRLESKYELIKSNIPADEKVPPLIFHTIVENGITHAFQSGKDGKFCLSCEAGQNMISYKLTNNYPMIEVSSNESGPIKEGMGMKYVKTRLEENYPGRWKLDYGFIDHKWQVIINIWKN